MTGNRERQLDRLSSVTWETMGSGKEGNGLPPRKEGE